AGFSADDRERAHALHRQHEPHEQTHRHEWRPDRLSIRIFVRNHLLAERFSVVLDVPDAVDDTHRRDEHFAGRERTDESDSHLPVEAQRLDRRLHEMPDPPGDGMAKLFARNRPILLRFMLLISPGFALDGSKSIHGLVRVISFPNLVPRDIWLWWIR